MSDVMAAQAAIAKVVTEEVWVRFSIYASNRGCGNYNIYAISTKVSKDGKNPYSPPEPRRPWDYTPPSYKLSEVMDWLKTHYSGRELTITFARYPWPANTASPDPYTGKAKGPDERYSTFEGHEFMQLLEKHPNAKRMSDWLNTNHFPPSHLRSYAILFPVIEVSQYGKDLV